MKGFAISMWKEDDTGRWQSNTRYIDHYAHMVIEEFLDAVAICTIAKLNHNHAPISKKKKVKKH